MVHLIPTEQAADEQVLVDSKRLLANYYLPPESPRFPGRISRTTRFVFIFVDVFWPNFDWQAENLASQSETLLFLGFAIAFVFSFAIHAVLLFSLFFLNHDTCQNSSEL